MRIATRICKCLQLLGASALACIAFNAHGSGDIDSTTQVGGKIQVDNLTVLSRLNEFEQINVTAKKTPKTENIRPDETLDALLLELQALEQPEATETD